MAASNPPPRVEELSENERRLLSLIAEQGPLDESEAAAALKLDPVKVRNAASWLKSKGFVAWEEESEATLRLTEEGRRYSEKGLPEVRLWRFVNARGGVTSLEDARRESKLSGDEFGVALTWWSKPGRSLGSFEGTGAQRSLKAAAKEPELAEVQVLGRLSATKGLPKPAVPGPVLDLLKGRKLVVEEERRRLRLRLADGVLVDAKALQSAEGALQEITPEVLKSGAWKSQPIRPFDVGTPAPRVVPGKPHPLVQIIQRVREIFLEMGFTEIEYDFVQSAFWNMDALFIPQDHPAREMQDTFYLSHPESLPVPEDRLKTIADVHRTGGKTGSRGWGGTYDPKEGRRALLRTHTTVGTIRWLADHPEGAARVFSVGRVFRKETMDATHLPEFHQVEGIATEEGADFPMLLGILKEFYRRLGFEKLRMRPGFFPYTEPSMEIEVFVNNRWMELGGSGIFRPEVTEPLGVKTPVLAWGLGLERLAMLRLGLTDIRDLYISDLEWLRKQPML